MTRLTEKNIIFVKDLPKFYEINKYNGRTIYVSLKGGVSQGRRYESWDDVPATVRRFCLKRKPEVFEVWKLDEDTEATTWIYNQ